MLEYLGGPSFEQASAHYVASGRSGLAHARPREPYALWELFDGGHEVGRSLWDRRGLLAHLDIDYVNQTFPGEFLLDPERTFAVQRPTARGVEELLGAYAIRPLRLIGGRGSHYTWSIARGSRAFSRLVEVGRLAPSLEGRYRVPQPPQNGVVGDELGRAHAGLGLVMEFLAHLRLGKGRPALAHPGAPDGSTPACR